jgi:DNA/RNA endonuclease G (NUC1)
MDNTIVHPESEHLAHLIDLFLFQGAPKNNDASRQVQILVNHGYVAGFSPDRLQPLWAAYRVAHADRSVDYDRPHVYYADERLDEDHRLGPETFGKKDGVQYNVGHMVPNEVINVQFGRLAQMETFFMSNMSPQRGSLNSGVWLKLEDAIRNIEDTNQKDHVWAIAGPIFDDNPDFIPRGDGKQVPIPFAYYYITLDPFRYPWNLQSNVDIACFKIPQTAPRNGSPSGYLVDLDEIETATNLTFLPGWNHDIGESVGIEGEDDPWTRHRLLKHLA